VPVVLTGCGLLSPGECGEARSLDPALALAPPPSLLTVDDQWAAVAREVPGGFGGFYIDGGLKVHLTDPGRKDEALAALHERLSDPHFDVRGASAKKARWDFAQLYDWYRYINNQVWQVEGVISTDIDVSENRLVYGAERQFLPAIADLFNSMDLPCNLVKLEERGRIILVYASQAEG
jgi:hypothetical protein